MAADSSTPPRILLTGRPGVGKTTAVRRVVDRLGSDRCVGFFTEEVRQGGRRVGFDVVTLDGRRAPLARVGAPGPRVGRYGVDVEAFEAIGVSALETELAESRVLIVDEIGKMELMSEAFVELLPRVVAPDSRHALLGTVMRGGQRRVPALRDVPGLEIVQVTPANRDELPPRLSAIYGRFLVLGSAGAE